MLTYYWTFLLSLAACAGSLSAQSKNISVEVGSTAVLPCNWTEIFNKQLTSQHPHVEWCTFVEIVFERMGEEMYQGEGYEDRADVPEDKLREGDCSLVLKNVTPADAGLYESYLMVRRTKRSPESKKVLLQRVQLSVQVHKDAPPRGLSENKAPEQESQKQAIPDERNGGIINVSSWITRFLLLNLLLYIS